MIRRLVAEAMGTALLLTIVVGSGIMGERLAAGNDAIALLGNSIATGAGLVVLIHIFGPVSGAHFNPAVTLAVALMRQIGWRTALLYGVVQSVGAILGVWLAHAMFDLPILQAGAKVRTGTGQWTSEAVATLGLLATILLGLKANTKSVPALVACYITAAYWFTASTSFANPAVTIARSLTDTFAGIRWLDMPGFIAAQAAATLFVIAMLKLNSAVTTKSAENEISTTAGSLP